MSGITSFSSALDNASRTAMRPESHAGRAAGSQVAQRGQTRRRTQAERVAESDRRMLDAAVRLIAAHGSMQTTLEMVGVEAGYSRGLAQHRFGSKDGLLEAVLDHVVKEYRARLLPRLRGLRGLEAIFCEIDCYLEGMENPPPSSKAFFVLMLESVGPVPQIRHVFADLSQRWHRALAAQIRAGQSSGEIIAEIDPDIEAQLIIAAVRGIRLQSVLSPHGSNLRQTIDALKRDLRHRLAAQI